MQYRNTSNVSESTAGLEAKRGEATEPQIVGADRFDHAIVVQFDDGISAMFPVELLRSLIPQLDPSAIQAEDQ